MLGGVGVGAGEKVAPVRLMSAAGPDLLPGDHEVVAVLDGSGLEGSQVGARLRLAEALTPCDFAFGYGPQVLAPLLLRAMDHEARPNKPDALDVLAGGPVVCHLLAVDHGLSGGGVLPAILLGPGDGQPALLPELLPHLNGEGPHAVVVGLLAPPAVGQLVSQEGGELAPELTVFLAETELHEMLLPPKADLRLLCSVCPWPGVQGGNYGPVYFGGSKVNRCGSSLQVEALGKLPQTPCPCSPIVFIAVSATF